MYYSDVQKKEYLDKVALSGNTISRISLGDGGITVLGKEDKVGDGEFDVKFSCSSIRIHLPLSGNNLL